ncbi:hypothetical protein H2204_000905 [Knufia peltigerae]|uniref:Uncharacterized protein n=1 Tax=Knufia peltigerae TaxID=1002370 RepID=A0AA38YFV8_9EURO|nr:hypothetical protein H2204_000905 [Knufia peltigerae]
MVNALRRTRANPKTPDWFLGVLQTFWSSKSEKPQDQIYALLGFLEESTRPYDGVFHVDYERTVEEVFTDVVDYCISAPRSVDELSNQLENPGQDLNASEGGGHHGCQIGGTFAAFIQSITSQAVGFGQAQIALPNTGFPLIAEQLR